MKNMIHIFVLVFFNTANVFAADFNSFEVLDMAKLLENYGSKKSIGIVDEDGPIFKEILSDLSDKYEQIAQQQVEVIEHDRSTVVIGGLNSIGINFQKSYVDFHLNVRRDLAPDLFDDKRWIVHDQFEVTVSAEKFLGKLKQEGLINIDEKVLAAYAGISFKRTYSYFHFAKNYNDGLTSDFSSLFFPFSKLRNLNFIESEEEGLIKRSDALSLKAAAFGQMPISQIGGVVRAGVIAKYEKVSELEIQQYDQKLTINQTSTKTKRLAAEFQLQADFFKLLRITLLSTELEYSLSESNSIMFQFTPSALEEILSNRYLSSELRKLVKGKTEEIPDLSKYLIAKEHRVEEEKKLRYTVLLRNGMKTSKTQKIEIIKNGEAQEFYKHQFEKTSYTETLKSKIFSAIIHAILKLNSKQNYKAKETKNLTIEYQGKENLIRDDLEFDIQSNPNISLAFNREYFVQKTTGFFNRKYKKHAIFYLENEGLVDPQIVHMLQRDYLLGPLTYEIKLITHREGLDYFNRLNQNIVTDAIDSACHHYPRNQFFNFRNLFNHCVKELEDRYQQYFTDLTHRRISSVDHTTCDQEANNRGIKKSKRRKFIKQCLVSKTVYQNQNDQYRYIPMDEFKEFMQKFFEMNNVRESIAALFGENLNFQYGKFESRTSEEKTFTHYFHKGNFQGFGAIDNFRTSQDFRSPASIDEDF